MNDLRVVRTQCAVLYFVVRKCVVEVDGGVMNDLMGIQINNQRRKALRAGIQTKEKGRHIFDLIIICRGNPACTHSCHS